MSDQVSEHEFWKRWRWREAALKFGNEAREVLGEERVEEDKRPFEGKEKGKEEHGRRKREFSSARVRFCWWPCGKFVTKEDYYK